jgi:hypothetical protein
MADYGKACAAAKAASSKAKFSGAPGDHQAAAKAQREAASAAFASGDPESGKKHSKKATKHRKSGVPKGGGLGAWVEKAVG